MKKINNPARFWLGAFMIGVEILGAAIFGLTLIDWTWITSQVVLIALIVFFAVAYNILAVMFVLNGSKNEDK